MSNKLPCLRVLKSRITNLLDRVCEHRLVKVTLALSKCYLNERQAY